MAANEVHMHLTVLPRVPCPLVLPVHSLGTSAGSAGEAWALWDRQRVCSELRKWLPQALPASSHQDGWTARCRQESVLWAERAGASLPQHWQWPVLGDSWALRRQGGLWSAHPGP